MTPPSIAAIPPLVIVVASPVASRQRRLAELFPPDALADDYATTATATWSMSIEAADQLPPATLSRPLLELASMLDPNGFPVTLIDTPSVAAYLANHHQPDDNDQTGLVDWVQSRDALHNLARLSLLTLTDTSGRQVRVHALVQRVTLERTGAGEGGERGVVAAAARVGERHDARQDARWSRRSWGQLLADSGEVERSRS